MSLQLARELQEEFIHEDQSIREQIERDAEIVRIYPEEEPDNSLSMGEEHLSTIPETELDEVIKSSVENLILIPSEPENFSDIESECDVPVCDDSTTFSNPLFDSDNDSTSSDDKSFCNENVPKEIYSNPLFDEEIISDKIDASIISSLKINSLLEQFSGELAHIDLIPPGIEKADFDLEEEICLFENFFDSDSHMEEIDLFLATDDSMPPGIENDDYNSEGDIHDGIFFDFKPDMGVLTAKVVEDISEHYVLMPKLLPTQPTLCPDIDTLLPFSSENEDKVFNPGILSSPLFSYQGKITSDFSEIPMMISKGNIPLLDVSYLHFYPP
ncbi:hypothetical protein Tco_1522162 [Tanacetum coccineum]